MRKAYCLLFILILLKSHIQAQGCSDAGICTISNSSLGDTAEIKKNSFEVGYIFGKGLEDVIYNNAYISYSREFKKEWSIIGRVTYNQATGNFGTLGRLGDAIFIASYTKKIKRHSVIKPSLGVKIPLSASNFKINNISLPLDYQPSLGTFDMLIGFEYFYKKWSIDAAYQMPIVNINKNSFFDEYSASNVFPTTNLFRRKPDVLLRTAYTFNTKNKKWFFKPNVMAIYHLGQDSYEDIMGKRQNISNSNGFTINASIITDFYIKSIHNIRLNIAAPLLVRKIRPDGLTRSFVIALSYQIKF